MREEAKADVIFPYTRKMTGFRRYSEYIVPALRLAGVDVRAHKVRKLELSIRGKPMGGLLSQRFFSLLIRTSSHVVHSLSPDVIMRKTNVVTIHDLIPFHHKELFMKTRMERAGYRLMFGGIDRMVLIVRTEFTKKQLVETGIREEMIEVCGGSVESYFRPSTRPSPYPEDGNAHLVTVGDFNPRKRFDILYEAVNALDGVDLYHIGPVNNWVDRYRHLKSIADRGKNVHILGPRSDRDLVDYLTHADLFVYASDDEGFGHPPAEALSCGTRALLNPIPVFQEVFGNHVSYSEMDADSFSSAISREISKSANREDLLEFAKRFSPEEEARKVAGVYRKVAASHGSTAP